MPSRYFQSLFGRIHYRQWSPGLGSPVVMVHGLYPGASLEEFEHNVSALSREHEVFALDLLGFGLSAAPKLEYTGRFYTELLLSFMDAVVAAPATLIAAGQSAAYAAQLAVFRPDLVERLVFFSPTYAKPRQHSPLSRLIAYLVSFGGFYDTVTSTYGISEYLKQCFADPRHISDSLVDRLALNASRRGSEYAYARWVVGDLDGNLPFYLPRTSRPTLIIAGDHDEQANRIEPVAARNLCTRILPDAGTWVHDEKARSVNQLVTQFLAA